MRLSGLPVALALVLTLLAACSPDDSAQSQGASTSGKDTGMSSTGGASTGESSVERPETTAGYDEGTVARVGGVGVAAQSEDTVSDKEKAGGKGRGSGKGKKKTAKDGSRVTLKFTGEPGTSFSGLCRVGGEKRNVEGEVPKSVAFDTDGKKLKCDLLKRDEGMLKLTLVSGDNRYEQRTNAQRSTLKLSYSDSGFTSVVKTANANSSSAVSKSRAAVNSSNSSKKSSSKSSE